jgi:hypothetical protein
MINISELQVLVAEVTAEVAETATVEASAVTLLNTLGQFFVDHANDPAAIEAMGVAMTNAKGALDSSANSLAAAITANTPAA